MSSLIYKVADEMKKKYSKDSIKSGNALPEAAEKDPFARYRQAFEKKENFEVIFDASEGDGTLIGRDQYGIKLVLESEYLEKDLPGYESANKAHFVGVDFVVKVVSLDEAEGIVYLRSGYSNNSSMRSRLIREIFSELNCNDRKEDDYLVLPGRIIKVDEKRALVDILGKGILGIIPANEWKNGYTRHLSKVVGKGEVYDFVVLRAKSKTNQHKNLAFELTRKPITEDPWMKLKINNSGLDVGSVISVKCISKPAGKSYWWGLSPMVEDIEIMGDYSTSISHPMNGCTYKCRIKRYDPDNQKFQVVPFEMIDTKEGTRTTVKFLTERPAVSKRKS